MPKIAIGGQQHRAIGVMNRIVKLGRRSECAERDRNPADPRYREPGDNPGSEEHTSELQSLMRISYAVFCLKKKKQHKKNLFLSFNTSLLHTTTSLNQLTLLQ